MPQKGKKMATTNKRLKMSQLSKATQKGDLIPVEKLGQRLKDIREALGMTQAQMAKRLKIKQPVISRIEENASSSSLKTLFKIAGILECELLVALRSVNAIENVIRLQAEKLAKKMVSRTFSNMAMEKQSPTSESFKNQLEQMTKELEENPGPELWEE